MALGSLIGRGRTLTTAYIATSLLAGLFALGAYVSFDRALGLAQNSATDAEFARSEQSSVAQITASAGQIVLGRGARRDLRSALDRFAQIAPDPLRAEFVRRARGLAALSTHDPHLNVQGAALFAAAPGLLYALDARMRTRERAQQSTIGALRITGGAFCVGAFLSFCVLLWAVYAPLVRRLARMRREAHELHELVTVDPLTGTLNARSFQARGTIEIAKARRYNRPLSLLVIGADQFPAIEDAHGQTGGQTVLRALTSSFFAGTRVSDLVARVDSEQFAILLPETSRDGAHLLAERLRERVSALSVPVRDKHVSCTVSIGVAAAETDATFLWPTYKRADEALYEAKMRGRNRVVVAA